MEPAQQAAPENDTPGAAVAPEIETKNYDDGTQATGTAPLPDASPEGQAPAEIPNGDGVTGEAPAPGAVDSHQHPDMDAAADTDTDTDTNGVPDADADADEPQQAEGDPASMDDNSASDLDVDVNVPGGGFSDPSVSGDAQKLGEDMLERAEHEVEEHIIHPAEEALARFEEYVTHLPVALHEGFRNLVNEVRSKL